MSTCLDFVVPIVISLVNEVVPFSKCTHRPMVKLSLCMTFKEDVLFPKLRALKFMHSICSPFYGVVDAPSIFN